MDRAHRIGQKKVVNVYRLITRGTLEEKIMRCISLLYKYCTYTYKEVQAITYCVYYLKIDISANDEFLIVVIVKQVVYAYI